MDDETVKLNINIDPQKDFKAAVVDDGLSHNKIKDYLKSVDFEKIMKDLPLKTLRHGQSMQNTNVILGGYDQSGSMGDIFSHEMEHFPPKKISENFGKYSDKKIIIFDEFEKDLDAKDALKNFITMMSDTLDAHRASQACGEALAASCHQGIAEAVSVRRPVSFRPRATA